MVLMRELPLTVILGGQSTSGAPLSDHLLPGSMHATSRDTACCAGGCAADGCASSEDCCTQRADMVQKSNAIVCADVCGRSTVTVLPMHVFDA